MVAASSHGAIPFLDLVAHHAPLTEDYLHVLREAIKGANYIGGRAVTVFEEEFASALGISASVGVSSGTDGLRLAFLALGIRPGDEVITVPHTFIATTEAITQTGGVLRFVDIDESTMTIDPAGIEKAIGPRTVGIVPVHLYGQSADMEPILKVAAKYHLWVVEDACQAHGATYRGRRVGTIGDLAAFSFYPGKNLGALGDAGAVTSRDPSLLAKVRQFREHGQTEKYIHQSEGYTARLDAIQAGFLSVQLPHLSSWTERRRQVAAWYRETLAGQDLVRLPEEAPYGTHVYHLFVVRTERRQELQKFLQGRGIGTGLHYPLPLHLQQAYSHLGHKVGSFPISERVSATLLSLPMFPEMTQDQVTQVGEAIKAFPG